LPLKVEKLRYLVFISAGSMDDAPHEMVVNEVGTSNLAPRDKNCRDIIRAMAKIARQPVQHVQWQRCLHCVHLM
jgi:hypothetical protein